MVHEVGVETVVAVIVAVTSGNVVLVADGTTAVFVRVPVADILAVGVTVPHGSE